MESPGLTGKGSILALPHLWAPMVVLFAGLIVTGFTARAVEDQARNLAEEIYHKQHNALVALLSGREELPPLDTGETTPIRSVNDSAAVGLWLATVFKDAVPGMINMRIDTLERHTKRPLFEANHAANPDPSRSLRSEVTVGEHRWLLTTLPDERFLESPAHRSLRFVWLAGMAVTFLATAIAILLCIRIRRWQKNCHSAERACDEYAQQLNNMQVEKSILRQALNDSEQRSRDLVALSGAIICELDEQAVTGYISSQVADLLQKAPADLSGHPFEELIDPACLDNFHRTLQTARQERTIQRIDLDLLDANRQPVPTTLRVLALRDTLHGLSGYRLSLQPRTHAS